MVEAHLTVYNYWSNKLVMFWLVFLWILL